MERFLNKVEAIAEKIPEGMHHARDMMIGILEPNRRHDDPDEKLADMVRAEINASHRFNSFAAERSKCSVKW